MTKQQKFSVPMWMEYFTGFVFIFSGGIFLLHPEAIIESVFTQIMYGSFMILGGLIFFTKLAQDKIKEQERYDEYVNNLPKAKGKFED